jgi:hypothetical protein
MKSAGGRPCPCNKQIRRANHDSAQSSVGNCTSNSRIDGSPGSARLSSWGARPAVASPYSSMGTRTAASTAPRVMSLGRAAARQCARYSRLARIHERGQTVDKYLPKRRPGEGCQRRRETGPFWRSILGHTFPSSTRISERSSPSRVRFAAQQRNNGAPLTAAGRSERTPHSKRERVRAESYQTAALLAPFSTAIDKGIDFHRREASRVRNFQFALAVSSICEAGPNILFR